jgi:hypothetical protein
VVFRSMIVSTWSGVSFGFFPRINAARPVTCGVVIDVPLS